jgi:hypothetical protein
MMPCCNTDRTATFHQRLGIVSVLALVVLLNSTHLLWRPSSSSSLSSFPTTTTHHQVIRSSSSLATLENAKQCRFFLAESAIPRAGLGVFTAVSIKEGEAAQPYPDLCIYLTNVESKTQEVKTHTWQDFRYGAQWESSKGSSRAACEGFVTFFNSMSDKQFASAKPAAVPEQIHTNAGLDRHSAPGAGAISQYFGATSVARRDLHPGSELLLSDSSHDVHNEHAVEPQRPPEWLQKHGMCADNLKPGLLATDPTMGRGAFAARSMSKGTMVAPAPLQILTGDQYEFVTQTNQLLLNYCFQPQEQLSSSNGNNKNNVLLFPYGPVVGLINHSGPREEKKANVALRWSQSYLSHPQWLDLPLDEFFKMQYPGSMIVEYVATRDIEEGEEIYMDYGTGWEEAWKTHVQNWKTLSSDDEEDSYVYPLSMNRTEPFRTTQEQQEHPYPPNLQTVCDSGHWKAIKHHAKREKELQWKPSPAWPQALAVCDIMTRTQRADGSDWYNVSLTLPDHHKKYVDWDVPHHAIEFMDKPERSDQHLQNAFRHSMTFPLEFRPLANSIARK